MKLRQWLALRNPGYVYKRAVILLDRYGTTPFRIVNQVQGCIAALAEYGCAPTLPTPGRVVRRYPRLIRSLQDAGAEIAVHGYDHVDLCAYPPSEASEQIVRAARVFDHYGISVHGFRCPYLRCTDELVNALPKGMFDYSSNNAIWWDVVPATDADHATTVLDTLQRFYRPRSAHDTVVTPWMRSNMVEIPVSLPDDLQLHDGLRLGPEGIAQAWSRILHRTHQRGELFVLMSHPELASHCQRPLMTLLRDAVQLQPPVWIANLRDISSWWREKSSFAVAVSRAPTGLHISFTCSERSTILVRGLNTCGSHGSEDRWDHAYYQLRTRDLYVPADSRPFVGLVAHTPRHIVDFLQEQGYILDTGETATRCATYIDAATLVGLANEAELIDYIETSAGPLVRYWRWPGGAKSAICITGDLDALTLFDYASRLFVR